MSEPAPAQGCPKCGKKTQPETKACSRCGLIFALWKETDGPALAPLDGRGAELWQSALEHWSDSARHEEFLKHSLQTGTLAAAGRLYRERLDENPRDAVAVQMQNQVLAKAAIPLSLHKSQPRQPMTRSRWFWAIVLVAMALGIGGGLFWRQFR